jgi:hypothetical protein
VTRFRRLAAVVLAVASIVSLTAPARATLSVQDYLDLKLGKKEGIDPSLLYVYLWGALDALLITNQMAEKLGAPAYFCEPQEDVELSIEDFKAMVDEELEKLRLDPDFEAQAKELTVAQLALLTLSERFPCRD